MRGIEVEGEQWYSCEGMSWRTNWEFSELLKYDPQPGDTWHESYSFWLWVVDRNGDEVTIAKIGPSGEIPSHDTAVSIMSVQAFAAYVSYGSIPGTWCNAHRRDPAFDVQDFWAEHRKALHKETERIGSLVARRLKI